MVVRLLFTERSYSSRDEPLPSSPPEDLLSLVLVSRTYPPHAERWIALKVTGNVFLTTDKRSLELRAHVSACHGALLNRGARCIYIYLLYVQQVSVFGFLRFICCFFLGKVVCEWPTLKLVLHIVG